MIVEVYKLSGFLEKLFPKSSPVELLKEHGNYCKKAIELASQALDDYFKGEDISSLANEVDRLEEKADEIKMKIRMISSKLRWGYFSKPDISDLIHEQDALIDLTDDFTKMLTMNRVENCPTDIVEDMKELMKEAVDAVKVVMEAIDELQYVVESAFSPSELKHEEEETRKVEKDETATDVSGIKIGKKLYALKNSMNPADVVYLNNLVIILMKIADNAENVVERINTIVHS